MCADNSIFPSKPFQHSHFVLKTTVYRSVSFHSLFFLFLPHEWKTSATFRVHVAYDLNCFCSFRCALFTSPHGINQMRAEMNGAHMESLFHTRFTFRHLSLQNWRDRQKSPERNDRVLESQIVNYLQIIKKKKGDYIHTYEQDSPIQMNFDCLQTSTHQLRRVHCAMQ